MVLGGEDVAAGPLHLEEPARQTVVTEALGSLGKDKEKPWS